MVLVAPITAHNVLTWIAITSAIGFVVMGIDKGMAVSNFGQRISERTIWVTALSGGFLGVIVGARVFNHKTRKIGFWPPVVFAAVMWVSLMLAVWAGYFV